MLPYCDVDGRHASQSTLPAAPSSGADELRPRLFYGSLEDK